MMANLSKLDEINVLASESGWGWPEALRGIFQPRGVNLLFAHDTDGFIHVLEHRRIHTAIVDMDTDTGGLATVKVIRMEYPTVPCIILSSRAGQDLLDKALRLDVFGVVDKPVDMIVLRELLNRLFIKRYGSNIFAV